MYEFATQCISGSRHELGDGGQHQYPLAEAGMRTLGSQYDQQLAYGSGRLCLDQSEQRVGCSQGYPGPLLSDLHLGPLQGAVPVQDLQVMLQWLDRMRSTVSQIWFQFIP